MACELKVAGAFWIEARDLARKPRDLAGGMAAGHKEFGEEGAQGGESWGSKRAEEKLGEGRGAQDRLAH